MRKYLLFLILILISSSVFSLSFVETFSNDEDVVYGDKDKGINFTSVWVDATYVLANFSNVDNGSGNKTILGKKISSTKYEFYYEINVSVGDGIYKIPITGFGSELMNDSFEVVIDNTPPTIKFPKRNPEIVFDYTNVELKYNITDENGLKEVFIRGNWSGVWESYVPNGILTEITYSHMINNSYLEEGELVTWDYFAIDKANNEKNGNNNKFRVKNRTKIILDPESPNGKNGYYVSLPLIILKPDNTSVNTWYRWNARSVNKYLVPFYFNWSNTLGGVEEINYFSEFFGSSINETVQNKTIKVDITKPEIKDVYPANNSVVVSDLVNISVLLDDIYESNSGINESSLIFKINNVEKNLSVSEISKQKSSVSYYGSFLDGTYNISLYLEDNAGWSNYLNWSFYVNNSKIFDIVVSSPVGMNNEKKILLNVSLDEEGEIWYKTRKRFKRLCKDCDSYLRKKSFGEGWNNITVRAVDEFGNYNEENISFFVDSKEPKIRKVEPRKGYVNGEFLIKYSEDNVEKVSLFYNGTVVKDCESGKNKECVFEVNLSDYEGSEISYYFEIEDIVGNKDRSRDYEVVVDSVGVEIIELNYSVVENYVYFEIELDSEARYLKYVEDDRERKLCSRCDSYGIERVRKKRFSEGIHNITVFSEDEAGNRDEEEIEFDIDY
ncbi:hypothetical protein CL618_03755 [archaeon]|nr:hypothetical protein [archaeon]